MNKKIYAIIHNVRSIYNIGSMFRTADAVGIEKIFLTGFSSSPKENEKMKKTSLGAEKTVQWEKCWQIHNVFKKIKKQKVKIYAIEKCQRSKNINKVKIYFPCAFVVGNEVKGLSKTILDQVDDILEIPMFGKKESLNVSVAFGVAGYLIRNK